VNRENVKFLQIVWINLLLQKVLGKSTPRESKICADLVIIDNCENRMCFKTENQKAIHGIHRAEIHKKTTGPNLVLGGGSGIV
jgi:hypothetical protein